MEGIGSLTPEATSLRYLNGIDRTVLNFGEEGGENAIRFENLLSGSEQARVEEEVRINNRDLQIEGRQIKQVMDKDDYLKLLITQLQNQDPTNPMEDREFIAQMAQFSSLEQMTNISNGFQSLASVLSAGQATSMLGKDVEVIVNGNVIGGQVMEVTRGDYPQVLVDGVYYDISDVSRIREHTAAAAPAIEPSQSARPAEGSADSAESAARTAAPSGLQE
jgi:flagellar basal-body rod modification protein FlgD